MPKTNSRQGPAAGPGDRLPDGGPLPELSLYERLIDDGIVAADGRGSTVDHLTARRLAIWLAARPQEPVFALNLGRFAETGMINPTLKMQLRMRARSGTYADRSQAARMLAYCIGRGTGAIGEKFGPARRPDRPPGGIAPRPHDRARHGIPLPEQDWPETDGPG